MKINKIVMDVGTFYGLTLDDFADKRFREGFDEGLEKPKPYRGFHWYSGWLWNLAKHKNRDWHNKGYVLARAIRSMENEDGA